MSLSRIERAISLAVRSHEGQVRDGDDGLPYVSHPFEVMMNLQFIGQITDEDLLCVAMLHDVVECGGATTAGIGADFGVRVRDLVVELTRKEPTPAEVSDLSKGQVWQLRSCWLLGEISAMSSDAQTVKLADRMSNLQEAFRVKRGRKLARYLAQTEAILEIIPRKRNPRLWQAIKDILPAKT